MTTGNASTRVTQPLQKQSPHKQLNQGMNEYLEKPCALNNVQHH